MERKSRQPSFLSSGEGARKLFHYLWTISLGWSLSASTNHLTGPFSESKRRVLFILYYFTCLDALLLRVNSVGYFFFFLYVFSFFFFFFLCVTGFEENETILKWIFAFQIFLLLQCLLGNTTWKFLLLQMHMEIALESRLADLF